MQGSCLTVSRHQRRNFAGRNALILPLAALWCPPGCHNAEDLKSLKIWKLSTTPKCKFFLLEGTFMTFNDKFGSFMAAQVNELVCTSELGEKAP